MDFAGTLDWLATLDLRRHAAVEQRARWLLVDTLACIVAGLDYDEPRTLAATLEASLPGPVRWPGHDAALAAPAAAAVAATAACWHEGCEGLARAHGRPGLHAVPVAAALGVALGRNVGDVLDAIVRGYEIGARAGESMRIRAGLHVDGTWGLLGSVAAATALHRMDGDRSLDALAAAACQLPASLYAPVAVGCTVRNTYAAHATMTAMFLADCARAGITAPRDVFPEAAAQLRGNDTGEHDWTPPGEFLILEGYLKPYAAVRHVHYAAQAAVEWSRRHGGRTAMIRGLALETYTEALTYCGNRAPATPIQAQFSLSYGLAYALRNGELGAEAYVREALDDPEQRRLEALVTIGADDSRPGRHARLRIETDAGVETLEAEVVTGDPDRPFDEPLLRAKARRYMQARLGCAQADALVDHLLAAPLGERFTLAPPGARAA